MPLSMQDNLVRSVPVSSPTDSTIDLNNLDVCTPYWFTVRAATCGDESSSIPAKVELDDTKSFELNFKLEDASSCTSFVQSEGDSSVTRLEQSMTEALLSCERMVVSCFAGSAVTCSRSDASLVTFRYTKQ